MNTYISNNHTRKEYLVGNSIHKEYDTTLSSFAIEDIYEIAFNKNTKGTIVLDESKITLPSIQNFINDFIATNQSKTKIILLSENKINHPNIYTLPTSAYKCFDEYHTPQKISSTEFVLCHLDSENHKNNIIIQDIVYPQNKEIPIRLVGHPGIQHIQNVGIVTDKHMLDLIYSCSVYVNISNEYIYDAILYNKPILSSVDNEYVVAKDNFTMDDIKQLWRNKDNIKHTHNLKQHRISNIIKSIVKL